MVWYGNLVALLSYLSVGEQLHAFIKHALIRKNVGLGLGLTRTVFYYMGF